MKLSRDLHMLTHGLKFKRKKELKSISIRDKQSLLTL
jgi:hypothetical protein